MSIITTPATDLDQIRQFLEIVTKHSPVFEIRILDGRRSARRDVGVRGGYFDNIDHAVESLAGIDGDSAAGVYVTINSIEGSAAKVPLNSIGRHVSATSDADVARIRFLFIDIDPVRPAGTCSTDGELVRAEQLASVIQDYLTTEHGWPEPKWSGISGNGSILLYAVDLPVADRELIAGALKSLNELFGDESVRIDTTVSNPSRIVRVAGTVNAKSAEPSSDRPWRTAHGKANHGAQTVTREQLIAVAEVVDRPPPLSFDGRAYSDDSPRYDVPALLRAAGIGFTRKTASYAEVFKLDRCLSSDEHPDGACILQFPSGAVAYKCHHNSCQGVGWSDIRHKLGIEDPAFVFPSSTLENEGTNESNEGWTEPIPLEPMFGPALPLEALPDDLAELVAAAAEQFQTAPDLPAIIALGCISAAAGGEYQVNIPAWGWSEPVQVQLIAVAEPGNRKSAIYRTLAAPIFRFEAEEAVRLRPDLTKYQSKLRVLEKALSDAEQHQYRKRPDGKISDEEAVWEAALNELDQHKLAKPIVPRIIVDDATPEVVKSTMAEQGGAIAVMSAESAFMSNASGRYSQSPNWDVLLNGHAGDAIRVDRKGRESEIIDNPALTLCLMAQRSVLDELGRAPGFHGRGVAARLLIAIPVETLGYREIDAAPIPPRVLADWGSRLDNVLNLKRAGHEDDGKPRCLFLSQAALSNFREFRKASEPKLRPGGEHEDIREWAAKLEGAVLRIAGLLHIWQCPDPTTTLIDVQTIDRAIRLGDYFTDHARVAHRLMRSQNNHGDAQTVWDRILRLGQELSQRDLQQSLRGNSRFRTAKNLESALGVLEDFGYIRREKPAGSPGRPSTRIVINPIALGIETPSFEDFEHELSKVTEVNGAIRGP
jgi:hypothetical protein